MGSINLMEGKKEDGCLEIMDFFIVDFNFEENQYEILPKKENYYDKWSGMS